MHELTDATSNSSRWLRVLQSSLGEIGVACMSGRVAIPERVTAGMGHVAGSYPHWELVSGVDVLDRGLSCYAIVRLHHPVWVGMEGLFSAYNNL